MSRYRYQYPASVLINDGDWSGLVRPEIIEFYPTGNEAHNDNSFNRLLDNYHLSLILWLQSMELENRDFAKNTNKYNSVEIYSITWRAVDYKIIYEILQRTRKICNNVDPSGYYARLTIESPAIVPTRKYYRADAQLTGWLSGKVITEHVATQV